MEDRIPKELSWLAFNEHVLQEAADHSVPVIERVRYLGIFSNNIDEFFRVHVADVRRLATFSSGEQKQAFDDLLEKIRQKILLLNKQFNAIYSELLIELHRQRIFLIDETHIDENQALSVRKYFKQHIFSILSPFLLDEHQSMPTLKDGLIYFAIKLYVQDQPRYAVVDIPSHRLPRLIKIPQPQKQRGHSYIMLDDIIRFCLRDIFLGIFPVDRAEAYTFKLTRDASLELGDGITESFLERMTQSLKKRTQADAVRFVHDHQMPQDLLDILTRKLKLGRYDSIISGGRYHNSKDLINFPNIGPKYLRYPPLQGSSIYGRDDHPNILDSIKAQDLIAYHPYHNFDIIIQFLRTAAIDPHVKSIKICLYRLSSQSRVIDALINAAQNGKNVTAVVELQARFDEQANIDWAQRMTEAGIQVIFGIPGLKIHAKIILIHRLEGNMHRFYCHIGTGNFNEKTAREYTDISLMTYNQEICQDLVSVFDFLKHNYLRNQYKHLWVSPHSTRPALCELIQNEIEHAKKNLPCGIFFKCNNLTDDLLIQQLYAASEAGVPVRLIVRSMCSISPGVKNISEHIEAISIVDRFLEHPRIYRFENAGQPKYFISSADLMTRNLDYRVEVTCPIYAEHAKALLQLILDEQWRDNCKARIWDAHLQNRIRPRGRQKKHRAQENIQTILQNPSFFKDNGHAIGIVLKDTR